MRSPNIFHPLRHALSGLVHIPARYNAPEHILFASCTSSLAHPLLPTPLLRLLPKCVRFWLEASDARCHWHTSPYIDNSSEVWWHYLAAGKHCSAFLWPQFTYKHFVSMKRLIFSSARCVCGWNSTGCIRTNEGGHRVRCFLYLADRARGSKAGHTWSSSHLQIQNGIKWVLLSSSNEIDCITSLLMYQLVFVCYRQLG
jgi:hypothetical protein